MGMVVIQPYILVSKLKKPKTKFLSCTGYLNSVKKTPDKARCIANSSSYTTAELSKLLTSCLTAVKKHVIKYYKKVYERSGKNLFWSIKIQVKFEINLKLQISMRPVCLLKIFLLFKLLYLIMITDKLIDLIDITFNREGSPYLACNDRKNP